MSSPKPVVNNFKGVKSPVVKRFAQNNNWSFSFKFFNQIENFGLGDSSIDKGWFSSFLSRLKDLSGEDMNRFLQDHVMRQSWRYHPIDWTAYNIPIQKKDLKWLPADIIENDEIEIFQFHVSKALGRIIGFHYENIFYIILVDPMHNIQPSEYNDYKIRPTKPIDCHFTSLLIQLDRIKELCQGLPDCELKIAITEIPNKEVYTNSVILHLDNDYLEALLKLKSSRTLENIFQEGIISLSGRE